MKIIFAGTPDLAATALAAIHHARHEVALVLTQPDRASGRGMKLTPSPVAKMASQIGCRVEKPIDFKTEAARALVADIKADVMVVAAYGLLLPQVILDMPKYGCLNIHGSLLPRWRGAAPIQRAIEAGDTRTGIGIRQMEVGLDTGPILMERAIQIAVDETSATLFARLAALGSDTIVEALQNLPALIPRPQASTGSTYATKINKSESPIDWSQSAVALERRIRAFDPFPGCEMKIGVERIKIWHAAVTEGVSQSGVGKVIAVTRDDFSVQCGRDALRIITAQRAGGRRIAVRDLLRSFTVTPGQQCT